MLDVKIHYDYFLGDGKNQYPFALFSFILLEIERDVLLEQCSVITNIKATLK